MGKVAVITGGERGIGSAITRELAASGYDVAILYWRERSREIAETLRDEIAAGQGTKAIAVEVDVRYPESVGGAFLRIDQALGRVDVLVNNAGVNMPQSSLDVTEEAWDSIVDTSLKGTFFCSQQAARRMVAQGGSTRANPHYGIVNIASQIGLVGLPRRAAYCSAKAGIINLTRVLALEWAEHGIRVNAIAPTTIETDLTRELLLQPDYRNEVLGKIPQGVIGVVDDIAAAAGYLLSPRARIVTGQTLTVDGGYTAI